ncbi:MAG: DeoR/GlpR family DNA-binding transcription regulator [Paracoccaceae bacterium]
MPEQEMLSDRQSAILGQIRDTGFATLEALAETFGVSMQTVRRDVIMLQGAGLIERFHGGAGMRAEGPPGRIDHLAKRQIARDEKHAIALAAAALIPAGALVYIDVGTTLEAAAAQLAQKPALSVVTNSLRAALLFDPGRHDVTLLPGRIAGVDGSLTGADTVTGLSRLRPDFALVGCSGVEPAGAAMDFDAGKIAVKRMAMEVACQSLLLATRDKFGRSARAEIAALDRFDHVISGVSDQTSERT